MPAGKFDSRYHGRGRNFQLEQDDVGPFEGVLMLEQIIRHNLKVRSAGDDDGILSVAIHDYQSNTGRRTWSFDYVGAVDTFATKDCHHLSAEIIASDAPRTL